MTVLRKRRRLELEVVRRFLLPFYFMLLFYAFSPLPFFETRLTDAIANGRVNERASSRKRDRTHGICLNRDESMLWVSSPRTNAPALLHMLYLGLDRELIHLHPSYDLGLAFFCMFFGKLCLNLFACSILAFCRGIPRDITYKRTGLDR